MSHDMTLASALSNYLNLEMELGVLLELHFNVAY
jgi:hypothetical protein